MLPKKEVIIYIISTVYINHYFPIVSAVLLESVFKLPNMLTKIDEGQSYVQSSIEPLQQGVLNALPNLRRLPEEELIKNSNARVNIKLGTLNGRYSPDVRDGLGIQDDTKSSLNLGMSYKIDKTNVGTQNVRIPPDTRDEISTQGETKLIFNPVKSYESGNTKLGVYNGRFFPKYRDESVIHEGRISLFNAAQLNKSDKTKLGAQNERFWPDYKNEFSTYRGTKLSLNAEKPKERVRTTLRAQNERFWPDYKHDFGIPDDTSSSLNSVKSMDRVRAKLETHTARLPTDNRHEFSTQDETKSIFNPVKSYESGNTKLGTHNGRFFPDNRDEFLINEGTKSQLNKSVKTKSQTENESFWPDYRDEFGSHKGTKSNFNAAKPKERVDLIKTTLGAHNERFWPDNRHEFGIQEGTKSNINKPSPNRIIETKSRPHTSRFWPDYRDEFRIQQGTKSNINKQNPNRIIETKLGPQTSRFWPDYRDEFGIQEGTKLSLSTTNSNKNVTSTLGTKHGIKTSLNTTEPNKSVNSILTTQNGRLSPEYGDQVGIQEVIKLSPNSAQPNKKNGKTIFRPALSSVKLAEPNEIPNKSETTPKAPWINQTSSSRFPDYLDSPTTKNDTVISGYTISQTKPEKDTPTQGLSTNESNFPVPEIARTIKPFNYEPINVGDVQSTSNIKKLVNKSESDTTRSKVNLLHVKSNDAITPPTNRLNIDIKTSTTLLANNEVSGGLANIESKKKKPFVRPNPKTSIETTASSMKTLKAAAKNGSKMSSDRTDEAFNEETTPGSPNFTLNIESIVASVFKEIVKRLQNTKYNPFLKETSYENLTSYTKPSSSQTNNDVSILSANDNSKEGPLNEVAKKRNNTTYEKMARRNSDLTQQSNHQYSGLFPSIIQSTNQKSKSTRQTLLIKPKEIKTSDPKLKTGKTSKQFINNVDIKVMPEENLSEFWKVLNSEKFKMLRLLHNENYYTNTYVQNNNYYYSNF